MKHAGNCFHGAWHKPPMAAVWGHTHHVWWETAFQLCIPLRLLCQADVICINKLPRPSYRKVIGVEVEECHGMSHQSLMDVFRATVESKLQYATPAWSGLCTAGDRVPGWTRFSADAWSWTTENVLRHLSRTFLLLVMKSYFLRLAVIVCTYFNNIYLNAYSLSYSLRPRPHNKTLITKSSQLNDRDFIIRSIYKDSYWLHLTLPARIWSSSKYTVLLTQYSCYNYAISICILVLLANCHLFYFISLHLTVRVVWCY